MRAPVTLQRRKAGPSTAGSGQAPDVPPAGTILIKNRIEIGTACSTTSTRRGVLLTYGGEVLQAAVGVPADGALSHGKQGVRLQISLGPRALHPVDQGQVERAAPPLPSRFPDFLLQHGVGAETHPLAEVADFSQRVGDAGVVVEAATPEVIFRPCYTAFAVASAILGEEVCEARVVQSVRQAVAWPLSKVALP